MSGLLMERLHFAKGLDPVADGLSGTVYSDIINMKNLSRVLFAVYGGVATGGTGASTFTVEASDDVAGSNVVAIPFTSREIATGDTEGAITARAATGYVGTAGSSKLTLIEVREDALAASGYGYVRLKAVESVNDPVVTGILVIGESKVPGQSKPTAIV
jgi:hypothetical protein